MPKRMAYVCSPLSAASTEEMQRNMHNARRLMAEVAAETGMHAVAPHAYLPELLDDTDPAQRQLALQIGALILRQCSKVVVCGDRISAGMAQEISEAEKLGIPITYRSAI